MFPVSTQTSLDEIEDAGNSEFGGEFLGPHRSFLSRRASSPIAAAPPRYLADRGAEDAFRLSHKERGTTLTPCDPRVSPAISASRDALVRDVLLFRLWRL